MMVRALRKRRSFSMHFSRREPKFSSWADPRCVSTPIVGCMMACSGAISPGSLMPASKMPSCVRSDSLHTESGTPICEFHERGERVMLKSGASSW